MDSGHTGLKFDPFPSRPGVPLAEVVDIARRHGAFVHSDAVQALGKMPLRWAVPGVDMMSLSAHSGVRTTPTNTVVYLQNWG